MAMWLRLGGALLITVVVMAGLEYLGVGSALGRSGDEVHSAAHSRSRELFWFMIFTIVMATSVLAAARRWAGHLRRAVVPAPVRRRQA